MDGFWEIPVVSRCYLSGAILITTACFLDFVSPLTLYYNYDLIFQKQQYWRLITVGLPLIFMLAISLISIFFSGKYENFSHDMLLIIVLLCSPTSSLELSV